MDDCTAEVNICDDLVMNILSRLPPKSLVVCKCVSKSWRCLVSTLIHSRVRPWPMTGLFVHLSNSSTGGKAIEFFNRTRDNDDVDYSLLNYLPCHPHTRLVDCRDGLLLCSSNDNEDYDRDKYIVCNPITRQWVSLPYPPERYSSSGYPWRTPIAALVLDDDDDDHVEFDFCYSYFKVILFVTLRDHCLEYDEEDASNYLYVDVFSSRTGKWEGSKPPAIKDFIGFSLWARPSVYSDGVLFLSDRPFWHWDGDVLVCDPPLHLLIYHVKEEYCEELHLPDDFGSFHSNCLGKSQGRLHYAYHFATKMEVWMMIEGGGHSHHTSECEWVLKHSLDLADIDFPDPSPEESLERLHIVAFHPNSEEIFMKIKGDFFCYNFNTKAVDKITYYHPRAAIDDKFRQSWPCDWLYLYPFSPRLCRLVDAQQQWT